MIMGKIFQRWPVNVTILEKRANGIVPFHDKARYEAKGSKRVYRLKKRKVELPPIDKTDVAHFGGRNEVVFAHTERDIYLPVKNIVIVDEKDGTKTGKVKTIAGDMRFWENMKLIDAVNKYHQKGALEKFGWLIVIFVVCISISVIFYVTIGKLGEVNTGLKGVADQLARIVTPVAKAAVGGASGGPPY